jgi:hypothetical protein
MSCIDPKLNYVHDVPAIVDAVAARGPAWLIEFAGSRMDDGPLTLSRERILDGTFVVYLEPHASGARLRRGRALTVEKWSWPDGTEVEWKVSSKEWSWAQRSDSRTSRFPGCDAAGFESRFSLSGELADHDLEEVLATFEREGGRRDADAAPDGLRVMRPTRVDRVELESPGVVTVRTNTSVGGGQILELQKEGERWRVVRVGDWVY